MSSDETLATWTAAWLLRTRPLVKHRTLATYERVLRTHVLPTLGARPLGDIRRQEIRALADLLLAEGKAAATVRLTLAVLRTALGAAVEREMIPANPAAGIFRSLGRRVWCRTPPRALDRRELALFLEAVAASAPRLFPIYLLLARTGLRIGEALALHWSDVDLEAAQVRVRFTLDGKALGTPKNNQERHVDLTPQTVATLRGLVRYGPWVFTSPKGGPYCVRTIEEATARVLRVAALPFHVTPKDLRHTYASQLISAGASPAYVQQQLGHHSMAFTVDTYGKWLRAERPAALAALDEPGRHLTVLPLRRGLLWRSGVESA